MTERLELSAFACEFGDRERAFDSIEGLAALCTAHGLGLSLSAMGCGTFWQMTRPLESYVRSCVAKTLAASGVAAESVGCMVFATMDNNLQKLDQNFTRNVLADSGLVNCIPVLVTMQQCVSSLAAVEYARRAFDDPRVQHAIVVAFDFVTADADRVRPFALFGDAVTSCMVSRSDGKGLALSAYGVNVDFAALSGRDSFESRKRVAVTTLEQVLARAGVTLESIERCFSTNFYKPVALFNAGACGVPRAKLYIDSLKTRAHCGNCDWMINLEHYREHVGFTAGKKYLVQSFAPGFFACAVLES